MGDLARQKFVCIGIDFSINSPAAVALNPDGSVKQCMFINQTKKFMKKSYENILPFYRQPRITQTKKRDGEDSDAFRHRRNTCMANTIMEWVDHISASTAQCLVAMEGFATGTTNARYLDIAEAAGYVKHGLSWGHTCLLLRIHDPLTVKKWATGTAHAMKYHMRESCPFAVPDELFTKGTAFKFPLSLDNGERLTHDLAGPGADIVDAYFLAQMMYYELNVRSGKTKLEYLADYQIEIFNRVTKSFPESILSRSFV